MATVEQTSASMDEIADAAKDEIAKAMSQALLGFGTEDTNMSANTETTKEEEVIYDEVPLYQEPLQDPYGKAIKYLEQHDILQLFQTLTTNIVYRKPEDPLTYMMNEVEKIKKKREKEAKKK